MTNDNQTLLDLSVSLFEEHLQLLESHKTLAQLILKLSNDEIKPKIFLSNVATLVLEATPIYKNAPKYGENILRRVEVENMFRQVE